MTNWGEKCQERKIQFSSNYLLTELNNEYSPTVKGTVSPRKYSFVSIIC